MSEKIYFAPKDYFKNQAKQIAKHASSGLEATDAFLKKFGRYFGYRPLPQVLTKGFKT